jgi:hypothetical protein
MNIGVPPFVFKPPPVPRGTMIMTSLRILFFSSLAKIISFKKLDEKTGSALPKFSTESSTFLSFSNQGIKLLEYSSPIFQSMFRLVSRIVFVRSSY